MGDGTHGLPLPGESHAHRRTRGNISAWGGPDAAGRGRPNAAFRLNRTIVETTPHGWWYAALLPDGAPVVMFHTRPVDAARLVGARGDSCVVRHANFE